MNWTDLLPQERVVRKGANAPAVVMSAKKRKRGMVVVLLVRVSQLPDLDWWKLGTSVRVQLGHGDAAGQLRVLPIGRFNLVVSGGRRREGVPHPIFVNLPPWPGMAPGEHAATDVEFDYSEGWLQVTLPSWAATKAMVPPDAPAPGPKAPFVGLGTQGHAETFAGRRGSAPIMSGGRT